MKILRILDAPMKWIYKLLGPLLTALFGLSVITALVVLLSSCGSFLASGANLVLLVINVSFYTAFLASLVYLLVGCVTYFRSRFSKNGDDKHGSWKMLISRGIIGTVIAFLSYFIINLYFGLFCLGPSNLNLDHIPGL